MKTIRLITFALIACLASLRADEPAPSKQPTLTTSPSAGGLQIDTPAGAEPSQWLKTETKSDHVRIAIPETVPVLRIKRPFLSYPGGAVVVRLTDEEWEVLQKAYEKSPYLVNRDSSEEITFLAEKPAAPAKP